MTYQTPVADRSEHGERPLVSFVVATYNRKAEVQEAIDSLLDQQYPHTEIIVVSNATDGTSELFNEGARFDHESIAYHHFDGRMGVPGARNIGYQRASGDVVVTIDDDAVLPDPDATTRIVELFEKYPDTGILAFQSRNYYTDKLVRKEIPDPPISQRTTPRESYESTFFVGVGNAIRAEVFEEAGYYPEAFVYGFEEMDLSLRVLNAGYEIRYTPSVVVQHKKSPAGRTPSDESIQNDLENRLRILVRNLPWHYVLLSAIIWSFYALVRARLRPGPVVNAFQQVIASRKELIANRNVVTVDTIDLLKRRGGVFLWWYGPNPRRFLEEDVGLDRLTW